jgi:hypothetical protein
VRGQAVKARRFVELDVELSWRLAASFEQPTTSLRQRH